MVDRSTEGRPSRQSGPPVRWRLRRTYHGHTGTVTAATADLAAKPLRCGSWGDRQPFAPEAIARARRRPNGRRAAGRQSKVRRCAGAAATDPTLNDRLDDLVFAG